MNRLDPTSSRTSDGRPAESFTLYRFSLTSADANTPRQETYRLGYFDDIEDAFRVARLNAELAGNDFEIVPTEFGYDVRREYRTHLRFWIHARQLALG